MVAIGTYTYDDHTELWEGNDKCMGDEVTLKKLCVCDKGEGEIIILKVYWTP